MNLVNNYQNLLNEIFNGEKDIAIFVLDGIHYYVIDTKDNYCIDVRPEYQSYIKKGWMEEELYEQAISSFRNGIPVLSKDSFHDYVTKNNVAVYSLEWMKQFFIADKNSNDVMRFYEYIELFLSTLTEPVSSEWDCWRMRLPNFYINFDKKIYRHTDWDRQHETSAPSDWNAQANNDFGLFVPDREQYWLINGMNFWKLKM